MVPSRRRRGQRSISSARRVLTSSSSAAITSTWGDRAFVGPVAELLSPLHRPRTASSRILGNHDDDRDMPAALIAKHIAGAEGRAHAPRDPRRGPGAGGDQVLDARRSADIARVVSRARDTVLMLAHDPRRLDEAADLDVRRCCRGTRTAGRSVLPGVGAVARRRFPVLAGLGSRENTRMFVSRGVRNRLCSDTNQLPAGSGDRHVEAEVGYSSGDEAAALPRASLHRESSAPLLDRHDAPPRGCGPPAVSACITRHDRHGALDDDGPPSSSAVTRWTVTPLTLTPCSIACLCAVRAPGTQGAAMDGCSGCDSERRR